MEKHAIVRLDNVAATKNPSLIKSAKYVNNEEKPAAIDNGNFVEILGLYEREIKGNTVGEREIHVATTPKASSTYFGLVCTPELMYEQKGAEDLAQFFNEEDEPIRVIILQMGDIYSATAEAFDTVPTVGKFVELQAGTKGKVVESATEGSTQVGKIIAIDIVGRNTFYVVEVQ